MRGIGTLVGWTLFYAAMAFLLSHFLAQERRSLDPTTSVQSVAPTLEENEPALQARQNASEIPERMPCHYGKSIFNQDCAGEPQPPRKIKPLKIPPPEAN